MSFTFTEAQLTEINRIEQQWTAYGLSTEPSDHAEVERHISQVYEAEEHAPPDRVLWCQSPFEALMTIAYLKARFWRRLWKNARGRYSEAFWQTFKKNFLANILDSVTDPFWDEIGEKLTIGIFGSDRHPAENELNRVAWQGLVSHFGNLPSLGPDINAAVSSEFWPGDISSEDLERMRRISRDEFDGDPEWDSNGTQGDFRWLATHASWRQLYRFESGDGVDDYGMVARSVGMWWAFERLCLISERPCVLRVDDERRLHCETGPALVYPDGWAVSCWHGVRVPKNAILAPESITVAQIRQENNLETRRVLVERYGMERYLRDSGARELHRDKFGVLFRRDFQGQESLVILKVVNSTPEPDGSFHEYFVRVPPTMQTAHQAVAWTFGLRASEYQPFAET